MEEARLCACSRGWQGALGMLSGDLGSLPMITGARLPPPASSLPPDMTALSIHSWWEGLPIGPMASRFSVLETRRSYLPHLCPRIVGELPGEKGDRTGE